MHNLFFSEYSAALTNSNPYYMFPLQLIHLQLSLRGIRILVSVTGMLCTHLEMSPHILSSDCRNNIKVILFSISCEGHSCTQAVPWGIQNFHQCSKHLFDRKSLQYEGKHNNNVCSSVYCHIPVDNWFSLSCLCVYLSLVSLFLLTASPLLP